MAKALSSSGTGKRLPLARNKVMRATESLASPEKRANPALGEPMPNVTLNGRRESPTPHPPTLALPRNVVTQMFSPRFPINETAILMFLAGIGPEHTGKSDRLPNATRPVPELESPPEQATGHEPHAETTTGSSPARPHAGHETAPALAEEMTSPPTNPAQARQASARERGSGHAASLPPLASLRSILRPDQSDPRGPRPSSDG